MVKNKKESRKKLIMTPFLTACKEAFKGFRGSGHFNRTFTGSSVKINFPEGLKEATKIARYYHREIAS